MVANLTSSNASLTKQPSKLRSSRSLYRMLSRELSDVGGSNSLGTVMAIRSVTIMRLTQAMFRSINVSGLSGCRHLCACGC